MNEREFTLTFNGETLKGTVIEIGNGSCRKSVATMKGKITQHTSEDRYAYAAIGKVIAQFQGVELEGKSE
jgi:hypothetical protein